MQRNNRNFHKNWTTAENFQHLISNAQLLFSEGLYIKFMAEILQCKILCLMLRTKATDKLAQHIKKCKREPQSCKFQINLCNW